MFSAFWLANALRATAACLFRHLNLKKCPEPIVFFCILSYKRASRHAAHYFCTSELQKAARDRQFFGILSYKCVLRDSGVPFFDIGTTKSGPRLRCFVHFHLKMLRAGVPFFHMTSALQKSVRPWGVLYIGLRATVVPFFISVLNSYLRTRRFSKPTFRTSGPTNHWKSKAIRDFPNISRVCIFFLVVFYTRVWIFFLVTVLACGSSFFGLGFSTLLFNCPYCWKLDF